MSGWRSRRAGIAAVLLALLAAGCQTTTTSRRGGALAPQAFFWEVKGPEGGQLFLLGSVHIGDGRELALDPRIEKDWQAAQELVVELDITSLSPVDAVEAMSRHGLLPEPATLQHVVRAETYAQVAQYMKLREYSMDRIDQMRPWMVALVVQELEYGAAGLQPENGVDAVLLRRAKGQKPIVALESLDEQMSAFASLPDSIQETWLVDMLRESQALLGFTRELLRAWEAGDEAKLMAAFFSQADSSPDQAQFYERMYWGRNRAMAERLAALAIDGKPRFVVVGTGHLLGPRGVPELLAQRGFKVSRVGSARVIGGTLSTPAPASAAIPAPTAPQPAVAPAAPATASESQPVAPAASSVPASPTPTPAASPATGLEPAVLSAPAPASPAPSTPLSASQAEMGPPAPAPAAAPARVPGQDVHEQWLRQDVGPPPAVEPAPVAAPTADPVPTKPAAAKPAATKPAKSGPTSTRRKR